MNDLVIENLVFEGGGVKGIAYGGALLRLKELGHFKSIKRVGGTSAGAITAVLLAVGYSPEEIIQIMSALNFRDFADDSIGVVRDLKRFITRYGYHKGDRFLDWIEKKIRKKTGQKNLTFSDCKLAGLKDLVLVATDLSNQKPLIFSYKTTSGLSIAYAARMSMSIPLYYQAYWFEDNIVVDGGIAENYPIYLFDNDHLKDYVNIKNDQKKTLGFRLDTREEILRNQENWAHLPVKINDIVDYSQALIGYMMEVSNKKHLKSSDKARTVFIPTLGIKTTDFDITDLQKDDLMGSGYLAVTDFFKEK